MRRCQIYDLASGGATIDSALVQPYLPTVLCAYLEVCFPTLSLQAKPLLSRSIVNQVSQFNEYLANKPAGAEWESSNSLFAVWIGINDVVCLNFALIVLLSG